MISTIKTKQDLIRALQGNNFQYQGEIEVVNEVAIKLVTEKARALLRQQKKLHIVVLERP